MKNLPAKFYLSLGLTSLLTSLLLIGMFFKLIPDQLQMKMASRVAMSETLASASSLFLQNGDFGGIRANLEFAVQRHQQLLAATVTRNTDRSSVTIGELPPDGRENFTELEQNEDNLYVPILKNEKEWGSVRLFFTPIAGSTFLERYRNSKLAVLLTLLVAAFLAFYVYLGKMLKQLNPSAAVPGRVRSALDTIAESLLVINRKGELVLANEAFGTLMGQSADSLLGKKADSLPWSREESDSEEPLPWDLVLSNGEPTRHDMIWMVDSEGSRRKFIVNCSPVSGASGKPGGVLISLDDVTLLEQKEVELVRSKQEADEANQAKSEFLSNMSHEIRTPMTAILGFTEVLKRGYSSDTESSQKYLNTISRSGKHLLQLINDILDLSKVESGALEVENIDCSPHKIVYDVMQVLNVKAEEKSIFLRHEVKESLPEFIQSDPARLRQIITNLVGNAIKFTETGGVTIALRTEQLNGEDMLALDVSDTGIGMTPEALENIFEAFSQADTSITRRFGGTGLGLSISKDLSRALGGDIVVTSTPGEGSTFTVLVGAGAIDRQSMLTPAQIEAVMSEFESEEYENWSFKGSKVLVVDDAAENRDLLTLVLNEMDIDVDTAINGRDGVDKAMAADFDVVMMDIQMPIMDGYEAAGELSQRSFDKPLIALTANAMKGYEERVLAAGFTHYMTKPIDIDKLSALLGTLLNGEKRAATVEQKQPVGEVVSSPIDNLEVLDQPIVSTLASENEKFKPIADSFIVRLRERLPEMEQANAEQNFPEMASIAHWLKGSAGSVGFGVLTEPALELELAAKSENAVAMAQKLDVITNYAQRLASSTDSSQPLNAPTVSADSAHQPAINPEVRDIGAATPIESSLATSNAGFRAIVRKFIPTLQANLAKMDAATESEDYAELASLAHWLKGSGGTVGFSVFTEPAKELEIASKANDKALVDQYIAQIHGLAKRLVVPEEDYRKSA